MDLRRGKDSSFPDYYHVGDDESPDLFRPAPDMLFFELQDSLADLGFDLSFSPHHLPPPPLQKFSFERQTPSITGQGRGSREHEEHATTSSQEVQFAEVKGNAGYIAYLKRPLCFWIILYGHQSRPVGQGYVVLNH